MSKNIENTRIDKAEYKRIMTNRINEVLESEKFTFYSSSIKGHCLPIFYIRIYIIYILF